MNGIAGSMSTPSTSSRERRDGRLEVVSGPRGGGPNNDTEPARYVLCLGKASDKGRAVRGKYQPYSGRRRQGILEKLDALTGQPFETFHHRHALRVT